MMRQILVPVLASILLWSCTRANNEETRYATVLMRDGSSVRGFVVASSAKEIQLNDANKESRTIPMMHVRSIEYEDAVSPNAAVTAPVDKSSGAAAKGAAIGAGSGAGAGALTQVLTKGRIKVPVESILTFQLDKPIRVQAAR